MPALFPSANSTLCLATHTDAELTATVRMGGIGKLWLRGDTTGTPWASGNHNLKNGYYVAFDFPANQYRLRKTVGSTDTLLASRVPTVGTEGFSSFAVNSNYSVRFQVQGSTIRARVWLATAPEPTTWDLTVVDTSLTVGRAAVSLWSTTATGAGDVDR